MKTNSVLSLICPLVVGAGLVATAIPGQGRVTVEPRTGVAGNFGTWRVVYEVGPEGMATGGGIRVELPDAWHAGWRNSANALQATDPAKDNYISARSSRPGVKLATDVEHQSSSVLVKSARPSLDERLERYVFVVEVKVRTGRLEPGDRLTVVYGDTTGGSRGMRAGIISTPPLPVQVAVDARGDGRFELSPDHPSLKLRAGPAEALRMSGPSTLVLNHPAVLHLAVVDRYANPSASFRGRVRLRAFQGKVDLPKQADFTGTNGWVTVRFVPREVGLVRLEASALARTLQAVSNPMQVYAKEPERKIYWGDLHSHSHYSWDGVGRDPYDYARFVSGLDFYALTDHSRTLAGDRTRGLGPHNWKVYSQAADAHYRPGVFVTLHAYECSFGPPYGHRNVYFRGAPGALLAPEAVTLPQLWKALHAGQALTIPHHTGKFPRPVSWDYRNDDFQRNIEIYSAHGSSEFYNPEDLLSFEHSDFTGPSTSAPGPQFAQDGWIAGQILSVIGSSDDHRAHPGRPEYGLAAVAATGLTREAVFDGLYQRHTYGTTGVRILLDFRINGQAMGRRISSAGPPHLEIEAHGTDQIESVEVLRYCRDDGGFKVIREIHPDGLDFEWADLDRSFRENSIYYVRLRQKSLGWPTSTMEPVWHHAIAMAWSSPIWVKKGK